jgi:SAM-dependent methyltransferase
MTAPQTSTPFDALVAEFLGAELPEQLAAAVPLQSLPADAQGFIRRMLRLMQRANYPVTEFNVILVQALAMWIPNMLPCAWGGKVPPITNPGRHQKLDAYVEREAWAEGKKRLFVDLGCGFPPVTTADTAKRFPDWQVLGVDRAFAHSVVTDAEGNYACFDGDGNFQYFQAMMTPNGRELYANAAATRRRFQDLYAELSGLLSQNDGTASETVAKDNCRLVSNHLKDFERQNLSFVESDIDAMDLPPSDVIRCMNVLVYVNADHRQRMIADICDRLRDRGLFIHGTNGPGVYGRYAVFEKWNSTVTPREFAFSLENLRPFGVMPWFTIHDEDPEAMLLADLIGALRADADFWPVFDRRIDALLAEKDICRRGDHGYLVFPENMPPVSDLMVRANAMWQQAIDEGYRERAVAALQRAGWKAWVNAAGDIAIQPVHWRTQR